MANWCFTRITINHESETELEKLDKLLDEWTSKDYMDNGFGHKWLGNIVLGSGVGTVDTNKETDLRCRGWITDHFIEDNQLHIDTETAWNPMLQMWTKVLEKYLPDAELLYEAEECGNEIYSTNDPTMKDCYIIDCCGIEDVESDWEASEETVRKTLQELLNTTEADVEKLIEMLDESEYDECMSIHKWDFDDISTWE